MAIKWSQLTRHICSFKIDRNSNRKKHNNTCNAIREYNSIVTIDEQFRWTTSVEVFCVSQLNLEAQKTNN